MFFIYLFLLLFDPYMTDKTLSDIGIIYKYRNQNLLYIYWISWYRNLFSCAIFQHKCRFSRGLNSDAGQSLCFSHIGINHSRDIYGADFMRVNHLDLIVINCPKFFSILSSHYFVCTVEWFPLDIVSTHDWPLVPHDWLPRIIKHLL